MTRLNKTELKGELRLILLEHQGRSQAITGKELAKMLGHRDDRQIRQAIRELIKNGLPIASSTEKPAGYFIIETWTEKEEYEQTIKSRLIEDAYRKRDFRKAAAHYLTPASQRRMF